MKRMFYLLMAVATMAFAACSDDPVTPNGDNSNPGANVDVSPFLGDYLMTRTADLTLSFGTYLSFPIDRDLNIERVTVRRDPNHTNGVVMTSSDGMYLLGTVMEDGLHLQNDTIGFAVDTLGVNASLQMIASHPVIAQPVNGVLDWTRTVSGTPSVTLPIIGQVTCTITGDLHYHSVLQ
jgi:hypothetical protein